MLHSFLLMFIFLSILIALMPPYCYIQLTATNSTPLVNIGKWRIFYGVISYILLGCYRVLMAMIVSFPYRLEILRFKTGNVGLKNLLVRDLKYVVTPITLSAILFISLYWFIIFNYRGFTKDLENYVYFSVYANIALMIISVIAIIYLIPATVIGLRRLKKAVIVGFSASLISSVIALSVLLPLSALHIVLWSCNAEKLGINVVNPNTSLIEVLSSIDLGGLAGNIIWYVLYPYLLYVFSRRHI